MQMRRLTQINICISSGYVAGRVSRSVCPKDNGLGAA